MRLVISPVGAQFTRGQRGNELHGRRPPPLRDWRSHCELPNSGITIDTRPTGFSVLELSNPQL
jgi:hypothetical protein